MQIEKNILEITQKQGILSIKIFSKGAYGWVSNWENKFYNKEVCGFLLISWECLHFLCRFDILEQITFLSLCFFEFLYGVFPCFLYLELSLQQLFPISMFVKWLLAIQEIPIIYLRHLHHQFGHFFSLQELMDPMEFWALLLRSPSRLRIFSLLLPLSSLLLELSGCSSQLMMKRASKDGDPILSGFLWGFLLCR